MLLTHDSRPLLLAANVAQATGLGLSTGEKLSEVLKGGGIDKASARMQLLRACYRLTENAARCWPESSR